MKTKVCSALALAAATLTALPAMAAPPSDVRDLEGARAAGGESALQDRGYVHIKTRKDTDTSWSYWWNASRKQCVMVGTYNGRYDSIDSTTSSDCNQNNHDGSKAALAAAAIIGVAVLAHNAHDHEKRQHEADAQSEADFDAGFRDGQYNHSYSPQNRSDRYAEGYEAGVHEREQNSGHRYTAGGSYDSRGNSDNGSRYSGGYTTPYRPRGQAGFSDLQGARGSSADSQLSGRGFANVDGFKSDNAAYTIWFNPSTRQCVQMAVVDGKVDSILDIRTHPKCR
ncbi:hypothetical protein [Asticcacaulis sp.]|uniref:hypothetical protein n=1 Tax=Asticcacaulis sp. TaxID=1872648 RepID=UPI0031D6665D